MYITFPVVSICFYRQSASVLDITVKNFIALSLPLHRYNLVVTIGTQSLIFPIELTTKFPTMDTDLVLGRRAGQFVKVCAQQFTLMNTADISKPVTDTGNEIRTPSMKLEMSIFSLVELVLYVNNTDV